MRELFLNLAIIASCPACRGQRLCEAFAPDVWLCRTCGLYFRNPRPTESAVVRYYDASTTYDRWQQETGIRRYLWHKRSRLLLKYKTRGALLDVGTGDGFFLPFANRYFETFATEVSKRGGEYIRARGFHHWQGALDDIDFGARRFDVVTLWHVLEHLHDPSSALNRIYGLLAPGGIMAVAVPNETIPIWGQRLRRSRRSPFGTFRPGDEIHLVHFLPGVFRRTLKRHGFDIIEFGVDDVHLSRGWKDMLSYQSSVILNAVCHWHFDAAMYAICRKA